MRRSPGGSVFSIIILLFRLRNLFIRDLGQAYNINADTAAAQIAIALKAEKLVSMTDIAGLLRDKDDETTLIPEVEVSEIEGYKAAGII